MDSTVTAPKDDLKSKDAPQSSDDAKEEIIKPETNETKSDQSKNDSQETPETPQITAEKSEDAKKPDENDFADIPELKPMTVEEKKDNGETPTKKRTHEESEKPITEKKETPSKSSPKKKPKLVIVKSYGFGDSGVVCEVCFTEENLDQKVKCPVVVDPLIKCTNCGLLAHADCYFPKNSIDDEGFFECDACEAVRKGEGPVKAMEMTPEKKKRSRRSTSTTPTSPGPLPSESEAKDDGRLHPRMGDTLDIFCQLCLRRDVVGGMKPTDTGKWVHLSCTMSTVDVFRRDGLMYGVEKALERSRKQVKAVERSGITVTCEACDRPGGYLIQCAHKPEQKNKSLSEPRCQRFLHPLCAEVTDRDRVIKTVYTGDTILFKCAIHTFDEDRCVLCNQADRQNEMLECDGCEKGYHMSCLYPPLDKVPDGDWFCDNCKRKNKGDEEDAVEKKNVEENDTKDEKVAEEEKKSQPSEEEDKKGESEEKQEESQEKKEPDAKEKDAEKTEKQETESKEKEKESSK